jgi:hypothetical protein
MMLRQNLEVKQLKKKLLLMLKIYGGRMINIKTCIGLFQIETIMDVLLMQLLLLVEVVLKN